MTTKYVTPADRWADAYLHQPEDRTVEELKLACRWACRCIAQLETDLKEAHSAAIDMESSLLNTPRSYQ